MTAFEDVDRLYGRVAEVFGPDEADTLFDHLQTPPEWHRPDREVPTEWVDPWVRYRRLYERSVEVLGAEAADNLMAMLRIPRWPTPNSN